MIGCLLGVGGVHAASVVFLNPGRSNEVFWTSYSRFMQAAADSLGMELRILYAERDPHLMVRQAHQVLRGEQRPDYLLLVNEEYVGPEILRLAAHSGVKLFMVNSRLSADQQKSLGASREKYPNWIGSLVPNDEEAGYLMAKELIRVEQARSGKTPVELLAFSGVKSTPAAQRRELGLRKALAEHPEVRLRQMVQGEWKRQRAYEQAKVLLSRYPGVRLIWAANDEMAFGAMQALQERGGRPGHEVLFATLNNSPEVLQARIDGRVSVLVSGHFTLGGWAMVLLHDYDAGLDFALRGGKDRQDPLFMLLDPGQSKKLLQHVQQKGFNLDFRRFSAVGHPDMRDYQFSLRPLLD
ncbi:LacI family transcriptional regulator [Pseudomonas cavernae]|uniref:LacI family transcriptional regulator n=1 Tax=Pseudomonas cavernae TaxID=2320867 RepID=A0A385Z9V9_9PSED|nr:ABC transporter substrate-binding protein [Pseudomonas cavernae]AYC35073.1 LacI family transcriptional regulator [Pseudomonas cavernae]